MLSVEVYNSRTFPDHDLEVTASFGWESLKIDNSLAKNNGLTAYFSLKRNF